MGFDQNHFYAEHNQPYLQIPLNAENLICKEILKNEQKNITQT